MKKILTISCLALIISFQGLAQDLPLFNQKLTNSFLYNPSMAGNGMGSLTFSHRSFWNGVSGAHKTNFISAHIPFGLQKFGAGFNVIQERIGVSENLYATGAFAYHLKIQDDISLSFGLSAEFTNLRYNTSLFDAADESDVLLADPANRSSVDFSFGTSFKHRFFEVGFSSNRLATAFEIADFKTQISQFYTAYGMLKVPLTDAHKLEPMFVYRKLSSESSQWDAGLYYSFRDAVILGASYRSGGILNPTAALRLNQRFLIGYTFEMFGTGLQQNIGNTNEITLRLDFMEDAYYRNTRNSSNVMRQSMAFRRKTLSSRPGSKSMGASNNRSKAKIKRNYVKSPSYRINNSKKLNRTKIKRKPASGKGFKLFDKKPVGATKFKSRKRQKSNYKKYRRRNKSFRR